MWFQVQFDHTNFPSPSEVHEFSADFFSFGFYPKIYKVFTMYNIQHTIYNVHGVLVYWSIKLWCANWISKWVRSNRNNPPGPRALLCTLPTPAVIAKSWKFAENHKAVYDCCLEINFSSHKLVLCFGNWFFWSLENCHVISVFELFWHNLCLGLRRKQLWWRVVIKDCVTGRAEQISNDLCWKWVPQWLGPNFPRWGTHPVTPPASPLPATSWGNLQSARTKHSTHSAHRARNIWTLNMYMKHTEALYTLLPHTQPHNHTGEPGAKGTGICVVMGEWARGGVEPSKFQTQMQYELN